jgi:hypothetical protein
MRVTKGKLMSIYAATLSVAAIALVVTPKIAFASEPSTCTIKCETCSCNINTGVCECKNCTLTGCTQT